MTRPMKILVVDDKPQLRTCAVMAIDTAGLPAPPEVVEAGTMAEAMAAAEKFQFDLAVVDLSLLGHGLDEEGVELIRWLHRRFPNCQCIAVTSVRGNEGGQRAMRAGAARFINRMEPTAEPGSDEQSDANWIKLLAASVRRYATVATAA